MCVIIVSSIKINSAVKLCHHVFKINAVLIVIVMFLPLNNLLYVSEMLRQPKSTFTPVSGYKML